MENWEVALIILFVYPFVELIVGFFFNYRIYMISKDQFFTAALMGAVASFLFILTMAITPLIVVALTDGEQAPWWIILIAAFATAIGNFFAAILVPYVSKKVGHDKKIKAKEQKEKNNEH
ncbi:hypothetical protein X271_00046 [Candidatus Hepatoplasma crinochetorum Av]|uniref:Uncharacterized protein n=1 Tax=Candidatus Hepatoplasma crinochetorum Av TaxID=1427984 RepID=W8GEY6_9MOLU|nr:hypothetical protein [Candidatus Hepatoplasma crinochetorum]AHK22163.1 hypothetical protein X271_00046 [Candidatus Hepatoplasma crinochetorum Av]